jgi:hypothetical protein
MTSQAQAAARVTGAGLSRWKRSRWNSVAASVSVVNISTAGTATRARAQVRSRAASHSRTQLAA